MTPTSSLQETTTQTKLSALGKARLEFDRLAGTELHIKKTNFYSSNDKEEACRKKNLTEWPEVRHVKHFKLVGSLIVARGRIPTKPKKERRRKATEAAKRIRGVPGG